MHNENNVGGLLQTSLPLYISYRWALRRGQRRVVEYKKQSEAVTDVKEKQFPESRW